MKNIHNGTTLTVQEVLDNRSNAYEFINFDKQETLEEGFDRICNSLDFTEFDFASFKLGAKWQMEKSYSEEEVINILVEFSADITTVWNITKWFKQFKKK